MTTYSNPRMEAVIEDWPSGSHRVRATFKVEQHPTRGERATRTTINPKTGKPSALKALTYARRMRIVDGDDGKTYIVADNGNYGFITVTHGHMKFQAETIWLRDGARFTETMALFG